MMAALADLPGCEARISILFEGVTQSWPLWGEKALAAAREMAATLPAGRGRAS
ncbi:hypothetical protein roselon_02191 [Roseibacterium elongatum DSM 19469]|uniref:Uncharacterized protein n=1 Tax=Roseicyclus elongatus DSM 19469 TaxID=1294273 RepID=W8S6M4_9RHOB|nr:hypothetical protein roselon_02191 [Roseibacterium elongatum DSM 19469]